MTKYKNCTKCAGTTWVDYPKCTVRCKCWKSKLQQLKEFGEAGGFNCDRE